MLKQFFDVGRNTSFEDWYLDFLPSNITIHNLKTGIQVREPSLVAVSRAQPDKLAAVGRAALEYKNAPDMAVFSPFQNGQIAQYHMAQQLIQLLLKQTGLKLPVPKPAMCIHIQERTTQVEEQALGEAAIQCGARKIFFYTGSLPAMLELARSRRDLQNAILIHIEPQE